MTVKTPWMRILKVTLTQQNGSGSLTIGGAGSNHLSIEVTASKYLAATKDEATVRISNLTYSEMVKIIENRFYNIEIEAGYENKGTQTVFKGGVLYMSNELTDKKTNTVVILCASKLIARFGQAKLNLTLSSGINLYSAVSFISKRAGITDAVISKTLNKQLVDGYYNMKNTTMQSYLQYLENAYDEVSMSVDASADDVSFNLFTNDTARTVKVDRSMITLTGGYPRMTNTGLNFTVLPIFAFMPGDILQIDNAIIDISAANASDAAKNFALSLNASGLYRLKQIDFNLENRGQNFSSKLTCMKNALFETGSY